MESREKELEVGEKPRIDIDDSETVGSYLTRLVRRGVRTAVGTAPLVPILGVVGFVIGTVLTIWTGPLAVVGGTAGMILGAAVGGVAEYRRQRVGRGHFPD